MKLHSLIVDDEHSGRISLKILLEQQFPYLFKKIITASSLDEAIEIVSKESFSICFLDIELNDRSGFDLLPYLPPETKVIFVTAYSEFAIRALREKAYDYLLKPINPAELVDCIQRLEKANRKRRGNFY
jgi:two-component system LytT family response regulator